MKLTNSPVRSGGPSCRKECCLIFLLGTWAKSLGGKVNSHCLDNKNYQILNPGINPIAKTYESEKEAVTFQLALNMVLQSLTFPEAE